MDTSKAYVGSKADVGSIREVNSKENKVAVKNYITIVETFTLPQSLFYYDCSFCSRELPNGGIRIKGMGACPRCLTLTHQLVNVEKEIASTYFNDLGVQK